MPEAFSETQSIGSVRMDRPPEIECFTQIPHRSVFSFADLVDGNGESWLNVSLHIFLPVVTEKTCSF